MWHRIQNLLLSIETYTALSPNLAVRQKVHRSLRQRPVLDREEWFQTFYPTQEVYPAIVQFVYQALSQYSGLEAGRLRPDDRFHEDLQWTQICWFDWDLAFCQDFYEQFGIDLTGHLDLSEFLTIRDLIEHLNFCWNQHQFSLDEAEPSHVD